MEFHEVPSGFTRHRGIPKGNTLFYQCLARFFKVRDNIYFSTRFDKVLQDSVLVLKVLQGSCKVQKSSKLS